MIPISSPDNRSISDSDTVKYISPSAGSPPAGPSFVQSLVVDGCVTSG